ncbi:MAG: hypothetical protein ACP5HU_02790 [Phycisphaerae bacterium]
MATLHNVIRVVFSALAVLLSGGFAYGYNAVFYHNKVEHCGLDLPVFTSFVSAVAPWVLLLSPAVLCVGLAWRRNELIVQLVTNIGWLFAVSWPPLCIWVWKIPDALL